MKPHIWGADVSDIMSLLARPLGSEVFGQDCVPEAFDLLIASECLWLHDKVLPEI